MNAQDALAKKVTPAEIALMASLADDLAAGSVDLFHKHEKQWRNSNLGQFMASTHRAPKLPGPVLDADVIFARFNRKR